MALTSGFFNGKSGDRKYDAVQLSHIFDGIINDGVYQSVGNIFHVAESSGMTVTVDTGRAWFNHTWTLNDALLVLTVPTAEQVLKRIDAVVLEVNSTETVRNNTIKILKGTPASTPAKPIMTNTDDVHQYPLAYITVDANVTEIKQTKIQNAVGTSACPFVTGIIDTVNIDTLITQWSAEFNILFAELEEMIEQAASQTIIDGSVTRAKLASDALYSPVLEVSASRTFVASDLGKTLTNNGASAVTLTLNASSAAALPVGAEIAVALTGTGSINIVFTGVQACLYGDGIVDEVIIPEQYGMLAIKKMASSGTTLWLITGNAEVVA